MGVVYPAYDPELDRRVAIEVMRVAEVDSGRFAGAQEQLLREGEAVARISHPNVIPIAAS